MPEKTFNNLPDARKEKIIQACIKEFEENELIDASVANIIARLGIARGTFYKYFKDIEDCYFYILSVKTKDLHEFLITLLEETDFDLMISLRKYGEIIAEELHEKSKYELYKNRYLVWNLAIQMRWKDYCKKNKSTKNIEDMIVPKASMEIMHIVKAVIHNLVERTFVEKWTKDEFLKKYNEHITILTNGIRR